MIVLIVLIFNSFSFGRVWSSRKKCILTVSTLGRSGGVEGTDFNSFNFGCV